MDSVSGDIISLREWAPLSSLLSQIPPKAQRGLFTSDLNLTCVSALPDCLAIGTNNGIIYWYNRVTHDLQRLRCENTLCGITCIGTVSSVDYMIAAGADNGTVTIFLVPKKLPENLPEVFKASAKKQVERYTVGGLHTAPVSAVEWSTNGMKLFSGDQKGLVVVTEIDFYMHLSKSAEVLNEKYEIVQLSYNPSQQLLLVSTLYRTILCHRNDADNLWKVAQVGNKERKTLGRMGATFTYLEGNPRSVAAFCSRPGLRLWISNKEGVVEKTLIYKDAVLSQHKHIQLLNPSRSGSRLHRGELAFGTLSSFMDRYLITFCPDYLLILDPQTISVVAALYDVEKISACCVSKSEIFILEGERHLIRLGLTPEEIPEPSPQNDLTEKHSLASHFLNLTAKLKDTSIISAIPIKTLSPLFSPTKSSGSSDSEHVSECMEALELPPVLPLDALGPQTTETVPQLKLSGSLASSDKEMYAIAHCSKSEVSQTSGSLNPKLLDKINQEQYEDVVYQPKRKQKKSKVKKSFTGTGSGSDSTSIWSSTSETDDVLNNEQWSVHSIRAHSKTPPPRPATEESQSKAIDGLSNEFGFSTTKNGNILQKGDSNHSSSISHSEHVISPQEMLRPSTLFLPESLNTELSRYHLPLAPKESLPAKYDLELFLGLSCDKKLNNESESAAHEMDSQIKVDSDNLRIPVEGNADCAVSQNLANSNDLSKTTKIDEENECCSIDNRSSLSCVLSCEHPSHSSEQFFEHVSLDNKLTDNGENYQDALLASGWLKSDAPQPISWFSVCTHYIIVINEDASVQYCDMGDQDLSWKTADYKADQISLSPAADHVWRLHDHKIHVLKNPSISGPHGKEWIFVGDNFRSLMVGNDTAWVVSLEGDVLCFKDLTRESPVTLPIILEKPCEWPAVKVACFSQVVWILLATGEVYLRVGISSVKPEGVSWKRVNIPIPGSISDIALGAQRTGWITDSNKIVFFSVDHMEPEPHWWQVLIPDFQHISLNQFKSNLSFENLCPTLSSHPLPSSIIVSNRDSLWIAQQSSRIFYRNKTSVTGHCWNRVKLKGQNSNLRWQTVTAEGVFENSGQLWLLSVDGNLFCLSPSCDQNVNKKSLQEVCLPSERGAVCLAAASQALWLLTSSGEIYIRQGLSDSSFKGNDWRELSLVQIDGVHLTHVSCGCDTVWACDTAGNVYMAISSPHAMATSTFSPAWIQVGDTNRDQNKIYFIKVCVGPQTSMVWALDNQGKLYVREAIFPDFQLGLDWVAVPGITALDLSISNSAVWVLSTGGAVYQRHGITQTNYIGDYWRKIPGSVEALSASICDSLWGIDKSGQLLHHGSLTIHLSSSDKIPVASKLPITGRIDDDDWEVVS